MTDTARKKSSHSPISIFRRLKALPNYTAGSPTRRATSAILSRLSGTPSEYRACVDKAIADAVAIVNRPLLSQYHQLRTKGDKAGLVQLAKAQ